MKPANFLNDLGFFFSPRGQNRSNSFPEMYSFKFSSFLEKQCLFPYLVLILLVILMFHFGCLLFFFFWTLFTLFTTFVEFKAQEMFRFSISGTEQRQIQKSILRILPLDTFPAFLLPGQLLLCAPYVCRLLQNHRLVGRDFKDH